jgi:RNA polymerase sigma-70 factor, ECF subfamily
MIENELILRAQQGDDDAIEALYRRHSARVYSVVRRLAGDDAQADDWAQEAWMRAIRALPSFRGQSLFSTWLHRIAVNVVVSYQRRNRPWIAWLRDSESLPEVAVESNEALTRDIDRAIARLPQRARQVFVLVEVEGYSHEETGRMLGMAVGTSKAHLFRARSLLREWLT